MIRATAAHVCSLCHRLPTCLDKDDLVSIGMIAARKLYVERWKPEGGASFKTLAQTRVKGAMLDEIRRLGVRTRRGKNAERPLALILTGKVYEYVLQHDTDPFTGNSVGSEDPDTSATEYEDILPAIEALTPREQRFLYMYHGLGYSGEEIGCDAGISRQRVNNLVRRAVRYTQVATRHMSEIRSLPKDQVRGRVKRWIAEEREVA